MQLDVEADVLPAPVGLHQGSCMEQDIEEGLQSVGRVGAWRPLGPSCLAEVWDWAPALLAQMQAQADGKVMLDSVRYCLSAGLQVNTDYSGMGGPGDVLACHHGCAGVETGPHECALLARL